MQKHKRDGGFDEERVDAIPLPSCRGFSLIGACDGLLLFERDPGSDHFVCNPVTRQWRMLPPRQPEGGSPSLVCGFYLHRPFSEHRLLYLTCNRQGPHHVYSLEAAEARRLGQAFQADAFCGDRPLVCLNHRGKLHWQQRPPVLFSSDTIECRGVEGEEDGASKIVAFDTESETFRRISPPPPLRNRHEGGLCLMEIDGGGELAVAARLNGSIDLWVLEDYNDDETWTCRLRVELRNTMVLLGDEWSQSIWLYDLAGRVSKQIQFFGAHRNALAFRESLKRHAFFDRRDPAE